MRKWGKVAEQGSVKIAEPRPWCLQLYQELLDPWLQEGASTLLRKQTFQQGLLCPKKEHSRTFVIHLFRIYYVPDTAPDT